MDKLNLGEALQGFLTQLGENEDLLSVCIDEILQFEASGILIDGQVRYLGRKLSSDFSIPIHMAVDMVQKRVLSLGAVRWQKIRKKS